MAPGTKRKRDRGGSHDGPEIEGLKKRKVVRIREARPENAVIHHREVEGRGEEPSGGGLLAEALAAERQAQLPRRRMLRRRRHHRDCAGSAIPAAVLLLRALLLLLELRHHSSFFDRHKLSYCFGFGD
ncbi:serine/threonine-protein kinase WNK (With NoLysine)-related [Striga asiatica]|uniref:Serine/threonine-protein kinase WNK (With NoLysine)-related n=1 Tax=Striga asiatica TaxID=4170 RepID=A0A5A7QCN7_STRAF|nr:serine/threonine-protein kinase WNK (With NoLysine)-related [Striga asiatica]